MIMTRAQRLSILFVLISIIGTLDTSGDVFHEQRLSDGEKAYASGRITEAIQEFRIASFGLADSPELLANALARLAIAHAALNADAAEIESPNAAASTRTVFITDSFALHPKAEVMRRMRQPEITFPFLRPDRVKPEHRTE